MTRNPAQTIDPNHHLWRNGRFWWVAYTVHLPGWKKARLRQSLGTDDLDLARQRRDALFRLWAQDDSPGTLSIRFSPPRFRAHDLEPLPGDGDWEALAS